MNVRIGVPWGNRVPVESNAMPNVVYGVGGGASTAGANDTRTMAADSRTIRTLAMENPRGLTRFLLPGPGELGRG